MAALAAGTGALSRRVLLSMGVDRGYDVRYVPDGMALRWVAPGVKLTLADAYWLAAVQYIGDQYMRGGDYARLYPLVDLVTNLDPRHGYAYQTAGVVLSTCGRLEESDRMLKKGMDNGPGWWSYPFYLAFNDFFYRGDYAGAARWAAIAARTPGASANISHLAMAMDVKSGDPQAAVDLLGEMYSTAQDESARTALAEQLKLAVLQRDFARLDTAVARFREERGRAPRDLDEIRRAGLLGRIPEEPFGGRYELRADGKVHSTAKDFRFSPAERGRAIPAPPSPAPPLLRRPEGPHP